MYMMNDDKARTLTDNDQSLIVEGLRRLRLEKVQAHKEVAAAFEDAAPGLRPYSESDFGIPQIDALIEYIEGPDDGETVTLEPPEPMII